MEVIAMMNFEDFMNYVTDNTTVEGGLITREVSKNNDTKYTAFTRKDCVDRMQALVNANALYEDYKDGDDIDNIIRKVDEIINKPSPYNIDFNNIEPNFVIRLVNLEKNVKRLKESGALYKEFLDLAIELRLIVSQDENGYATCQVNKQLLEQMGITFEDAYQIAVDKVNEEVKFNTMIEIMLGLKDKDFDVKKLQNEESIELTRELENEYPMYILTNKTNLNGAISMIVKDRLDIICDALNVDDIYILPSSVHEVIIIPKTDSLDADVLQGIIENANETAVEDEDYLSYHPYLYNKVGHNYKVVVA
jgi:hypothetical protein